MTVASHRIEQELAALLTPHALLTQPADVEPLVEDFRHLYRGVPAAVVQPTSTAEVAALLAWCHEHRVGVVPQGGNTGYCGGATPDASGTQVLVSLRRLNRIRRVDAANFSMTVEAGVVLAEVQRAAAAAQRFFPLSLGSEGSCQIGGNVATNAGGISVLRYGMMRDLTLGLEVVLADGRVLSLLTALRKDNTGYDLRNLFIGSEGTLGVITAATLKLFPAPRASATAWIAVRDVAAAIELLGMLRAASGDRVDTFELLPQIALDLVLQHIPAAKDPQVARSDWYVLCELTSSADEDVGTPLEAALEDAIERGLVQDAALAQSGAQRDAFKLIREAVPEAQRHFGAGFKHDISVPVSSLAEFMARGAALTSQLAPEGFLVAYGHAGDGNLHFNLSKRPEASLADFDARREPLQRAIHDLAAQLGGSFSAEHGIGRYKVEELERYAPPLELEMMRRIKQVLDPHGIMNPGKVLSPV
jgi:FAD/FMN-containing dehydrogenase